MKSFIAVLVVFVTASACAFTQQPVQQAQTQVVWQYGPPQNRLSIQNTAPWKCKLITVAPYKRSARSVLVAELMPGESVFAGNEKKSGFSSLNPFGKPDIVNYDLSSALTIPILALYVNDQNRYIGASAGVFMIPGAGESSVSDLLLRPEDIRFADDAPPQAPQIPPTASERPVVVPYFTADGTNTQIFVWNSSTPAHITMNGAGGDTLHLGDVKSYVSWSPIVVTISAVDSNGRMRTWSEGFQNTEYYGTYAQIFILGMSDLR